jgi:acetoin:2,6-dichlorophenolindophenol oxidoreductase subunit beta
LTTQELCKRLQEEGGREEGPRTGGWAAGVLGAVAEAALHDVDDAWTITTPETPIPYSPTLEDAHIPDAEAIARAVRARLGLAPAADRSQPV